MAEPFTEDPLANQLEAIAHGDVTALHALYEATKTRLFVVCLGIVREREAAEDVLQEIYLKIWNRAAGFDRQRGAAWPWLAMIARNTAIDWTRARARRAGFDGTQYLIEREAETDRPADEHLARMQESERALREVERLDEAAAQCLRAAFFEGLTYSEVADREGLPLGTVKSRIRRALRVLRERLADG